MSNPSNGNLKTILIASGVVFILLLQFGLKPYLHKRAAMKIVKTVLYNWANKNLVNSIEQWENRDESPPVYSLESYKILDYRAYKKDGMRYAEVKVFIKFLPGGVLPDNREWVFILRDGHLGWKVFRFVLAENA